MSALADRLRAIVAAVPSHREPVPPSGADAHDILHQERGASEEGIADLLEGQWCDADGHRFLVIDRTYRPGHRHGRLALLDQPLSERAESWNVLLASNALALDEGAPSRALFIDLETTGLAGGAGTYAFLVGCGWFEGCSFRVQQFLLTSHLAERRLLEALTTLADGSHLVVSYNGKTFDLPLIETRFLFNRMATPFADRPHLDMLHLARRLWRAERGDAPDATSCRLAILEQSVCGHIREDDVPGFEIPSRYFHYLRTRDARPLAAVIEHNRLDLLSLALLTSRAVRLVEEGPDAATTAREAVGLGHLFERAGMIGHARASYARSAGLDESAALQSDGETRADALRGYARLARRAKAHAEAATAWRVLLGIADCPPGLHREAAEALAVHHEHRLRDVRGARALAIGCLPLIDTDARRRALQHRLARLERKLPPHEYVAALF